jgi:hypothetical protein
LTAWYGGRPPASVRARLALWQPVTDVVWALWGRVQHAGGNDREDLRAYASTRLRRAGHTLAGEQAARALAQVAAAADTGRGRTAHIGLAG